ncbi:hypothetical protein E1I18_00245 [Mycoplasmopsis mucosicanis]|uniref:Uncharacterized protein n=1 Tax=Mycoplasmopsis mucosicanis TaxID=458208 RepID=A0A507SVI4_9BACT|nr:hypothetical protein [Mycoplasmopsis mucosicanis]TQC54194.1 hypothetical protein E1I18_00245 [Mycoplasmopsis mucosicanis]
MNFNLNTANGANTESIINPIGFFTSINTLNSLVVLILLAPLIAQIVFWRKFNKMHKYFKENNLILEFVKKDHWIAFLKFIILGVVGFVVLLLTFVIGESAFKSTTLWQESRYGLLICIGIIALISIIGVIQMAISYKKIHINTSFDWDKVLEYTTQHNLSFSVQKLEIRWLDPTTKQYEKQNQKDVVAEWKRVVHNTRSFSKEIKVPTKILKYWLKKTDTFFFKFETLPQYKYLLVASAVLNQLNEDGIINNLEESISSFKQNEFK